MEQHNNSGEIALLQANRPTLTQLVLANMPSGTMREDADRIALKEITNLEQWLQNTPALKTCTQISMLQAVKQCICDNLTLAPSANLVYLMPGQVKIGQNGNHDIYEWVIQYKPTANGKLSMARQAGRILDNKRPVVTYDGEGKVDSVTVEFLVPSYGAPRWEAIKFTNNHFLKWKTASANKNKGDANANYSSWQKWIDPEFAGTKAIQHGLNKLGINMNEVQRGTPAQPPSRSHIQDRTEDIKHEDAVIILAPDPTPIINPSIM